MPLHNYLYLGVNLPPNLFQMYFLIDVIELAICIFYLYFVSHPLIYPYNLG